MTSLLSNIVLLEGITHLEDLPIPEFIRTVQSLRDKIVTEKLDGANLWFGLDDTGLYTSREGKSPKKGRFYKVSDYPVIANYNAFRAAHLAITQVEGTIRKYFKVGDSAEIEVLFGRQPNTVTYGGEGKNFIVILRAVNGTPDERVQNLATALNNKTVSVTSKIVSSPDGNKLDVNEEQLRWQFTKVEPLEASKLNTKEAMALLKQLEEFCRAKNKEFPEYTNQEMAEISLTSVDKGQRAEAKMQREKINAYILDTFKAPIKELLLNNFVRKIKPMLQDKDVHPDEDIGVEGVVVRDPVTGSMTKIVDKDVFTAINTFNSAVRAEVSGLVRTTDQDAAVEMRGGAFGQAKIRIAELLGARELALSSGVKRFVTKFKRETPSATAAALAAGLQLASPNAVRTKIAAILKNAITEVDEILHNFKQEAGEFRLELKTGKEIGITPEVMKRTLTAFAETKHDIAEVTAKVLQARSSAELIMALYGRTIESLFEGGDEVKESFELIRSVNEDGGGGGGGTGAGAVGGGAGFGSASPGPGVSQMGGVGTGAMGFGSTGASSTSSAPGGGWDSAKPAGAGGSSNLSSNAKTTKAGNIAPYPFRLKGNKVVSRRPRNWLKPKKFPAPVGSSLAKTPPARMGVPEGKFSLLKAVTEDWAHVKDMKFAADVDDSAQAQNDVEFNQLRNNVALGGDVDQMDVNRYLDKAHEINDEVDTVVFGMEMDDGTVAKVYVNAAQGDEFEAALAQLLGKEDDVEKVINDLANKFDIVDVQWPKEHLPEPGVEQDVAPVQEPEWPDEPGIDGSEPIEIDDDTSPAGEEEGGEVPGEVDQNAEAPTGETPPEGEESEGEEEAPEEEGERDEFGQLKKKSKKAEESSFLVGPLLAEMEGINEDTTYGNPTVALVANALVGMGFDLDANRSFNAQAKMLIARNSPGLMAAKQNSVMLKFKQATDAFGNAIKLSPGAAPTSATQGAAPANTAPANTATQLASLELLGHVVAEAENDERAKNGWIIGKMGSSGMLLQYRGMKIKINADEAEKLAHALSSRKDVSVNSTGNKRFIFRQTEDGYNVSQPDEPNGHALPANIIQQIIDINNEEA